MKSAGKVLSLTVIIVTIALLLTGFTAGSSADQSYKSYEPLTDQIWAVKIEVEPGESGHLSQSFEAAYGAYDGAVKDGATDHVKEDSFGFEQGDNSDFEVVKGEDYVGNYFHIEQKAGTTGGTTKRYIDISSPWSGAYIHEDMKVEGEAEVEETFKMDNLEPGEEVISDWHDLF